MERQSGFPKEKRFQAGLLAAMAPLLIVGSFAQEAPPVVGSLSQRVVLVSIPDRKLAVVQDGKVIATFAVAVGAAATPSPTGEFTIVNRVANPNYYHPGTVIPAGEGNPLGTRWVGLSQKGYGIHGTNAPRSVGHARSHGCIRLRNHDMERLFTVLRVGDVVEIRGERDDETARVFDGAPDVTTLAEELGTPGAGGQE